MKIRFRSALLVFGLVVVCIPPLAFAQSRPPSPPPEEPVTLSAFTVVGDPDDTYEALNTSGVTGTNRSIRSLPITMNVFTRTFMDELLATDVSDVMLFTPNVSYPADSTRFGNQGPHYRLRGITSREERRRNGFLSLSRTDVFSTERIEVMRGAQALLYGQGASSGAVNTVTKQAMPGNFGEIRTMLGDVGTRRVTLDYNTSVGGTQVRFVGLASRVGYWQANLKDDARGSYLEVARKIGSRFMLRANHEYFEANGRARTQAGRPTVRDNSLKDPRVGRSFDELLYNHADISGIQIGGAPLSYENYRSAQSIVTGRIEHDSTSTIALEGAISPALSTRLAWNYQDAHINTQNNGSVGDMVAPTDSNAVNGQWSALIDPIRNRNYWRIWSVQAAAVYKIDFGRHVANQFVVGGEDRLKEQEFTPTRLYVVDANGQPVADPTNVLGRKQLPPFYVPIQNSYPNGVAPVSGTRWMDASAYNVVPATPANPRGLAGIQLPTLRPEKQLAGYVNWLGNWFHGRAETMAGIRADKVTLDNAHLNQRITSTTAKSNLAGIVYNVTPDFGIYANTTKSFAAAGTFTPTPDNDFPQPGTGISKEAGFKFDLFARRVSGSVAFFDNRAQNEALQISGAQRNAVDPAGINGRNGGNGAVADVRSRGLELVLTAQPVKGWRLYVSAGFNDATITSGMTRKLFYNDEFNTDGITVKVKQPDGSLADLMVPSIRTTPSSPRVPLTIAMLLDPTSTYRATINATSGAITNASALFLTTPGVGTGRTGLPITAHQLKFVPANEGIYRVFLAGDKTTPNAGTTAVGNTNYDFERGPLKDFSVGGTIQWKAKVRQGYAVLGGVRQLYYQPDYVSADFRAGYRFKLGRTKWSAQFTIQNVFDVQPVDRSLLDGGAIDTVQLSLPPRGYTLTTSTRF
jgi:outer membrane receptor protein involved in Fe transport